LRSLVRACVRVPASSVGYSARRTAYTCSPSQCALLRAATIHSLLLLGGRRRLPAAVLRPRGHCASPRVHTARESQPDCLSVACHRALRSRLTFRRSPARKNPSPLRSSGFSPESLLLPPRSALPAPPHALARMLLRHRHAPLLRACACAESARGCSAIHFRSS